jgi:hypothetical protein
MFDLISFAFEIFKYSSFFNDIISELIPLHVTITININLIEQISKISDQSNISIWTTYLPKLEMFFGNNYELF